MMEAEMKVNGPLVKRLREQKSWSQEHLASVADVSLRTVQRVESDGAASLETRMALASALDVAASELAAKPPRAPLSLGHKLGLACGFAGAAAGMYYGWMGALATAAAGQDAGVAYGTMAALTGITCALMGVIANRSLQHRG